LKNEEKIDQLYNQINSKNIEIVYLKRKVEDLETLVKIYEEDCLKPKE
jgi:hypothetical protein